MTQPTSGKEGRAVGAAAITVATAALACAACCLLPIALPAIALGSTGAVLAWFGQAHVWVTGLAILSVAVAWLQVWRQSVRRRARPGPATLGLMALATLVLLGALLWPRIEPLVIHAIRG